MTPVEALFHFEGMTQWMYRDNSPVGVVTVGVGQALFTPEDAVAVFEGVDPDKVRADYALISTKPIGYVAPWYAKFTLSRITRDKAVALAEATLSSNRTAFRKYCPDSPTFPQPALDALDDLNYTLGPNWPVSKKLGQLVWPHLYQAVSSQNWLAAAPHSHRAAPISAERNYYVSDLFKAAAKGQ